MTEQERRVLSVYYPDPPPGAPLRFFQRSLHESVAIGFDSDLPSPANYHILVAGRPTREQIEASSRLHTLIIPWAGLPLVTRDLMREHPQIAVHNLHHNAPETAEMALALLLAAAKRIVPMDQRLRKGDWSLRYQPDHTQLLEGRTALTLGYGEIGRRVARMCLGLGMRVMAIRRQAGGEENLAQVSVHGPDDLHNLLPEADALIVCLPLTEATEGWIGKAELELLPGEALLVNVGRGVIVEEQALYEALKSGALGAAGLDVWYQYPADEAARRQTMPSTFAFHELENVVLSPHRAGSSTASQLRRMGALAALLNAAAEGQSLPNRVDITIGY
ncbi:MAG TPA: hydroxyacid dehydrogenase [Anaerolineae bacterium]|nr:hydroxyacid dehydrogenase [Anaerolineae bacterium]